MLAYFSSFQYITISCFYIGFVLPNYKKHGVAAVATTP